MPLSSAGHRLGWTRFSEALAGSYKTGLASAELSEQTIRFSQTHGIAMRPLGKRAYEVDPTGCAKVKRLKAFARRALLTSTSNLSKIKSPRTALARD